MFPIRPETELSIALSAFIGPLVEQAIFDAFEKLDKHTLLLPPADEVLNVQQAATLLNRTPATIYGLVYEKRIPFHKPDGRLQFLRSELLEWVKNGRKATAADLDEDARTVVADRLNRRKQSKIPKATGNPATSKLSKAA